MRCASRCSASSCATRRWLAATALSLLGWPLQVLALALAPLALVQPTLALGLLLLLVLGARVLGERVGRRELAAVALDRRRHRLPGRGRAAARIDGRRDGRWCSAFVGPRRAGGRALRAARVVAPACSPFWPPAPRTASRRSRPSSWPASCADGRWAAAVAVAALAAAAGVLATVSEMSALQRLPATRVAPIVLAFQIAVPVVVVAAVGGEDWGATALGGAVLGRRAARRRRRGGGARRLATGVDAHRRRPSPGSPTRR